MSKDIICLTSFYIMKFLILVLATFRITSLLVNEDGPLNLLLKFRWLVGIKIDENGEVYGTNVFATGLSCFRCTSIWAAIGWSMLYFAFPVVTLWIALPFALSTGTILVNRWLNG